MSQNVSGAKLTPSASRRAVLAVSSTCISLWTRASRYLRGATVGVVPMEGSAKERKCGRVSA